MAAFVVFFELFLPLLIVGRDPERALELLLPSFNLVARLLSPLTRWTARSIASTRRSSTPQPPDEAAETANEVMKTFTEAAAQEGMIDGEERRLLQSIVDFGDALVREVMTPRPDIVAIREDATLGDLRALFREQEYSRFPVYSGSLDNILGFVFVKDLVALDLSDDSRPITPLLRQAVIVPESKRVPELLKQFQRQQTQCAIVVDEYGGTAGLVTIEDLLEEIVGEIRDEYDVESEPIRDEGERPFRVQRQRSTSTRSASGSTCTSSARVSRRSAATCCRTSAGCPRSANASSWTASASRCSRSKGAGSARSGVTRRDRRPGAGQMDSVAEEQAESAGAPR